MISDYAARPEKAAALAEQLAHAVSYAHQRGIVHRDLKPANNLLTRGSTPKITDFGLAKRLESDSGHTRTGDILGTPSYMAPEQASGRVKEIGTWTDIYALGAILYEMLAGVPPFEAATTLDILNQVLSAEPVSLMRRNSRVPRDLATICRKCLEKEPRKRYSSAADLADDLQRFREGRPITARPVGCLERTRKWMRRRPAVAALLAVSAAALLILLVGGWVAIVQLYQREQALETQVGVNRRALVRLHVINGNHFLDDEDEYSSLVWFARALALENAPARQPGHHLRIGMVLRECPRLGQLWFHKDQVSDVAFSPDGRWVLTASADHTAQIWDAVTGKPLTDPLRHYGAVLGAAFRHDGQQLATVSADRTARVWDARTGQASSLVLRHHSHVSRVVFSPDEKYLATASDDNTAWVWDVRKGRPLTPPLTHVRSVNQVCFSPDGRRVATGSTDRTARLWDAVSGVQVGATMRHNGWVRCVVFSPDGRRLATASQDQTAQVWDADNGQALLSAPLQHGGLVFDVSFSSDGTRVLTCSEDNTAQVWSAATGEPLLPAMRHRGSVVTARFSPDGSRVATASADNTSRVWDAISGEPLTPSLWHPGWGQVMDAAFSPAGDRLVTA